MTPAELQHALEQQQAESAALRAALAQATIPGPASASGPRHAGYSPHGQRH